MNRATLLRTLSVIALAAPHAAALARTPTTTITAIQGGGATAPQGDYVAEFSLYNSTASGYPFSTFWGSGSGTGQQAFLQNDLTCDINKVTGANSSKCSNTPGGANVVHYGVSDTPLNSTQIATWATSSWGQSAAGNLIQLPAVGTAQTAIIVDTNVTSNGQLELSDNDLCGIFSGLITDFSQITDSGTFKPAPGVFKLAYRSDSSGSTFILTNHLATVCNSSNSKAGVTFSAVTTFANLFTSLGGISSVIPNAVGLPLASGIANYLAGLSNGPIPQAIGYDSPDWTSIAPNSAALLSNGQNSNLLVASVFNGKKAYLPTTANIIAALAHAVKGSNLTPPSTAAQGANPALWVPVIGQASTGYPVVGYSTIDLAQCYADKNVTSTIKGFLTDHYSNASYLTIQSNNGLVSVSKSGAAKFLQVIKADILANKKKWNTDIGDAAACKGLAGR